MTEWLDLDHLAAIYKRYSTQHRAIGRSKSRGGGASSFEEEGFASVPARIFLGPLLDSRSWRPCNLNVLYYCIFPILHKFITQSIQILTVRQWSLYLSYTELLMHSNRMFNIKNIAMAMQNYFKGSYFSILHCVKWTGTSSEFCRKKLRNIYLQCYSTTIQACNNTQGSLQGV